MGQGCGFNSQYLKENSQLKKHLLKINGVHFLEGKDG
jgi:hypothetical protein